MTPGRVPKPAQAGQLKQSDAFVISGNNKTKPSGSKDNNDNKGPFGCAFHVRGKPCRGRGNEVLRQPGICELCKDRVHSKYLKDRAHGDEYLCGLVRDFQLKKNFIAAKRGFDLCSSESLFFDLDDGVEKFREAKLLREDVKRIPPSCGYADQAGSLCGDCADNLDISIRKDEYRQQFDKNGIKIYPQPVCVFKDQDFDDAPTFPWRLVFRKSQACTCVEKELYVSRKGTACRACTKEARKLDPVMFYAYFDEYPSTSYGGVEQPRYGSWGPLRYGSVGQLRYTAVGLDLKTAIERSPYARILKVWLAKGREWSKDLE